MARSVHLSNDVYDLLTALKADGESYSDTVRRLASSRYDPAALRRLRPPRDDHDLAAFRAGTKEKDLAKLRRLGLDGA